ncbi:MAG: copper amine oxidase N-terminal domain-containing protein [Candidatus Pristimantibacillus sp.]
MILALALVIVAGCQAVGGVDFNAALKQSLKVTSMEGKQSLELKLLVNEQAYKDLPEEDLALIQLVSNLKLQIEDIKVQDASHASYKGKLALGEALSIGFSLKMSDMTAVVELEGAKAPFVIDLTEEGLSALMGMPMGTTGAVTAEDQQSMTALGHELIDSASTFFINNLPNPENISVKAVSEPINGVSTSLMHINAELDGPAIWAWAKKYVDALAADSKGLETLITSVVTIMSDHPEIWEAAGTINPFEQPELDAPTKEETIKQTAQELTQLLVQLQEQIKVMETEDKESIDAILNKDTTIKTDIYVDSKLDIRKQVIEATIKPADQLMFPVDGIVIRSENEQWNVNGTVKADEPVVPEVAFNVGELVSMQGYQTLRLFDDKSAVYGLLKNQFKLGHQIVALYPDYDDYPPIVTPSYATIVPLRVIAEELGATVGYDKKTKAITVFDEATNTTIALKEGSDMVTVNGKSVKWAFPATTPFKGTLYVSARGLADAFGAKIYWETYDNEQIFYVEREVS